MDAHEEYALRRLSRVQDHSATLSEALRRKGATQAKIDSIIADCVRLGYINDHDWVALFVRSQRKKGYGDSLIRQKLFFKKIPRDQVEEALQDSEVEDVPPSEAISKLLSTRLKNKEKPKQVAALMRRGYTYSDIQQVLQNEYCDIEQTHE